jgi:hypothetical protein
MAGGNDIYPIQRTLLVIGTDPTQRHITPLFVEFLPGIWAVETHLRALFLLAGSRDAPLARQDPLVVSDTKLLRSGFL